MFEVIQTLPLSQLMSSSKSASTSSITLL
jgi:hypothetical protein